MTGTCIIEMRFFQNKNHPGASVSISAVFSLHSACLTIMTSIIQCVQQIWNTPQYSPCLVFFWGQYCSLILRFLRIWTTLLLWLLRLTFKRGSWEPMSVSEGRLPFFGGVKVVGVSKCLFSVLGSLNYLAHSTHLCIFFSARLTEWFIARWFLLWLWISMCFLRDAEPLNDSLHSVHGRGLSPVCVSIWVLGFPAQLDDFLHAAQSYCFYPL